MTTHKALIGALPLIASALGDKYGVKVVFGNYPTAATDGKTIYMPHLPLEGKAVSILANGFIDHEASHVANTDFRVFGMKSLSPVQRNLLNILEDLRIEQAMMKRYPGTRKNLNRLATHMVEVGAFSLRSDMSEIDILLATALFCGRADVLSQEALIELANDAEKLFEKRLGKGALVKMKALLMDAHVLVSTKAALDLANKMIEMLKEEQKKAEQQQQQSQSDDNQDQNDDSSPSDDSSDSSSDDSDEDQSQDGSSGSSSDDSGDDSGDDQAQGSGNSDDDQDDQGDADGKSDKGSSSEDDSKGQDGSDGDDSGDSAGDGSDDSSTDQAGGSGAGGKDDLADALKRALEASEDDVTVTTDLGDAISDQLKQDLADVPHDQLVKCDPLEEMEHVGTRPPVQRSDVRRETVKMRAKLIAKIETMLRERTYTARTGRKIEGRQLSRVAVGDSRIFRKTDEKKGLDTAIHVLVDRSGSMQAGNRMPIAMKSTMALMSTFDSIKGVSSAATVFPGLTRLTNFNQTVSATKHRYVPEPMGTTPLGEALLWLIKDMADRRENRKIVIVLTDGAPNDPEICRKLIKRMAKHDIEVIGIGIETMAVEGLFPTSAVINDVRELPGKLFNLIQEKLVQ